MDYEKMTNAELDSLAATRIMGLEYKVFTRDGGQSIAYYVKGELVPMTVSDWHPTTDLNQAFMIVDIMRKNHFLWFEMAHRPNGFVCNFVGDPKYTVFAETHGRAIVIAALMAVEVK